MRHIIDNRNYFAKATLPTANPWKSQWLTQAEAIEQAKWFVREWLSIGWANPQAAVFYRDGSHVQTITPENCLPSDNQIR
jgi:hypothetical protein